MFQFNHFNFNVLNLEKSLEFYKEALGLDVVREKDASDGSFKIVYLGDGSSDFLLELTWMRVLCQNHLQSKPDGTLHPQDYKVLR